jgi:hypothetical protein
LPRRRPRNRRRRSQGVVFRFNHLEHLPMLGKRITGSRPSGHATARSWSPNCVSYSSA